MTKLIILYWCSKVSSVAHFCSHTSTTIFIVSSKRFYFVEFTYAGHETAVYRARDLTYAGMRLGVCRSWDLPYAGHGTWRMPGTGLDVCRALEFVYESLWCCISLKIFWSQVWNLCVRFRFPLGSCLYTIILYIMIFLVLSQLICFI